MPILYLRFAVRHGYFAVIVHKESLFIKGNYFKKGELCLK